MSPHTPVLVKSSFHDAALIARALYDDGNYQGAIQGCDFLLNSAAPGPVKLKALSIKGAALWETGETSQCLDVIVQEGPLLDGADSRAKANFYGQRGLLYRKAGKHDEAFIDYEAAQHFAEEAGDREILARVHNNRAKLLSETGRLDEAITQVGLAIKIAHELGETVLEGRFYDLFADILLKQHNHEGALQKSTTAIALLSTHASADEARATHARILYAVVGEYLAETDPVESFRLRRVIVNGLTVKLDGEIVRDALLRSDGQVAKAAKLLNVKHPSLIEFVHANNLPRRPKGHSRTKSLIKV